MIHRILPHIRTIFITATLLTAVAGAHAQNQNVGIGTVTPDPSAVLDVSSLEKGILVPSMSTLQRLGINNPADGLMVYDTDNKQFWYYNDDLGDWHQASGPQPGEWAGYCVYQASSHGNIGAACDVQPAAWPVTGIRECVPGWTWINVSARSQASGTANDNHWVGACIKNPN